MSDERLLAALRSIRGPADVMDPFMDAYMKARGGYEGLQAIAQAALDEHEASGSAPDAGVDWRSEAVAARDYLCDLLEDIRDEYADELPSGIEQAVRRAEEYQRGERKAVPVPPDETTGFPAADGPGDARVEPSSEGGPEVDLPATSPPSGPSTGDAAAEKCEVCDETGGGGLIWVFDKVDGREVNGRYEPCPECGPDRDVYFCPKCGWKGPFGSTVCVRCASVPAADDVPHAACKRRSVSVMMDYCTVHEGIMRGDTCEFVRRSAGSALAARRRAERVHVIADAIEGCCTHKSGLFYSCPACSVFDAARAVVKALDSAAPSAPVANADAEVEALVKAAREAFVYLRPPPYRDAQEEHVVDLLRNALRGIEAYPSNTHAEPSDG